MALILAVDPGDAQAEVLGRLAQELPGHEFLSADSSASAVSFVQQQVPDLVLVPLLLPESERVQLQTQLSALSASVQTLTIPMIALDGSASASSVPSSPTEPCDPRAFADQIRQYLNGPQAAGTGTAATDTAARDEHARRRTHLVAAAAALTSWVQGRRAAWSTPAPVAQPADAWTQEPVPVTAAGGEVSSPEWASPPVTEPAAPWVPTPPAPSGPSIGSRVADAARSVQDSIRRWLPRVALLVVAIALVAGGRAYWPSLQAMLLNGTLVLESVPDGSEVFIDGTSVGTTPLTAELRGGSYTIEFRNGDESETVQVVVPARDRVVERLDWTAEPAGSLRVASEPSDARVLVDGEERGRTPLMLDEVSVGPHTVVIESAAGTVRKSVTIVVDQVAVVDELIFDGWVAPVSPFDIQITENGRTLRPDDRGQIALSPGSHRLRIQNVAFGYDDTRTVDITPANTTRLDIVPPPTSIRVTSSQPADVFIDGTRVGSTPLSTSLALGTREVVVRTAAGDERREFVTATVAPVEYHADFSQR